MDMFNLCVQQTEARKNCYSLEILFCSEILAGFKDSFCVLVTDVLPNTLYKFRLSDISSLCLLLLMNYPEECIGKFSCLL